jgi:hypothetical protein
LWLMAVMRGAADAAGNRYSVFRRI